VKEILEYFRIVTPIIRYLECLKKSDGPQVKSFCFQVSRQYPVLPLEQSHDRYVLRLVILKTYLSLLAQAAVDRFFRNNLRSRLAYLRRCEMALAMLFGSEIPNAARYASRHSLSKGNIDSPIRGLISMILGMPSAIL
jgi:hypothetical protein